MGTMTSIWATGTYELLIHADPEGDEGDLMVVVFAHPVDPEDEAADEDAPLLMHIDVARGEYEHDLQEYQYGLRSIGERGMLRPEDIVILFEPRLAVRILLAVYQAAERDFHGMDMDGAPFRAPSEGALPLMQRIHPLLMGLRQKLYGS